MLADSKGRVSVRRRGWVRTHDLCVSQEAFLFKGTVRFNLDPTDEHTDKELWDSLAAVELKVRLVGPDRRPTWLSDAD